MKYRSLFRNCSASLLGVCLAVTGCARPPAGPPVKPVSVKVSVPVERVVTEYAEYTAQIAAVDFVQVKAHVWGYLEKVNFKEGDLVKKDDVLFELDPRPYQATLNQAKAKVAQDEAQLKFDDAEYRRNFAGGSAVSRSDLDKSAAARDVDIANVEADKAVVASRQLDLDYTKITAPVTGRVSRYAVTVGNLVQSGDQSGGTLLTTIVSVDPMYAYFDVDERTVQLIQRLQRQGKLESDNQLASKPTWEVSLGLTTEDGFPHRGTINFVDNQVNPKTGTLRIRGVFPNPDEALTPGFFARVRVPVSPPHQALLVNDQALDNDQGQRILYVLNEKNEVLSRPVHLGQMHSGLREITGGLKPGDRVIVSGLMQVRPGATVEPNLVPMPTPVRTHEVPLRNHATTTSAGNAAP
jgi:RND family efflux transporter MFP subunit